VVGGGEGWDKASGGGAEGNPPRVSGGLRQNAQPGFGSARANRCQDPRGSVSMGKYRNSFETVKRRVTEGSEPWVCRGKSGMHK